MAQVNKTGKTADRMGGGGGNNPLVTGDDL